MVPFAIPHIGWYSEFPLQCKNYCFMKNDILLLLFKNIWKIQQRCKNIWMSCGWAIFDNYSEIERFLQFIINILSRGVRTWICYNYLYTTSIHPYDPFHWECYDMFSVIICNRDANINIKYYDVWPSHFNNIYFFLL